MRRLLTLALASLLAACSGLRSSIPPPQSYALRAAPAAQPIARASTPSVTLRVLYPTAAPGLDSDHIMLVRADRRLTYYAASRWAAPLPAVVEQLAVDTFRETGAWRAVENSRGVWPAEYFLQLEIVRFEADDTAGSGPPLVHVTLDCTLGRPGSSDELVASFITERAVSASENRLGAVVAAFEQAAAGALSEAADRAARALQDTAAKPEGTASAEGRPEGRSN